MLHLSFCLPFEWVHDGPGSHVLPSHYLRRIRSVDQWRCRKPCSEQITSPVTSPSGGYDWRRARLNDLEHVAIKITHRAFHCERVLCLSDLALVDESLLTCVRLARKIDELSMRRTAVHRMNQDSDIIRGREYMARSAEILPMGREPTCCRNPGYFADGIYDSPR